MKVVFIQDVPNVAEVGDVKEVKKGHARNYLLPKGFAVLATAEELRRVESRKRLAVKQREERMSETRDAAGGIDGIILTFAKRVTSKGNIYGSVSSTAIQHELKQLGHEVEKSMIKLEDPLRQLGEHEVEIELNKDAIAKIKIVIEPSEGETPEEAAAEEQPAEEPEAEEAVQEEEPEATIEAETEDTTEEAAAEEQPAEEPETEETVHEEEPEATIEAEPEDTPEEEPTQTTAEGE